MRVVAGIDEAGYGPLMGPLVISSVAFRVPGDRSGSDLWALFGGAICRKAARKDSRVRVADSKAVYCRRAGLVSLEKHLLPFAGLLGPVPNCVSRFTSRLCGRNLSGLSAYPWYRGNDPSLPRQAAPDDIQRHTLALTEGLASAGASLCAARFELLDVATFNRDVRACNNKSVVLAQRTSVLMADLRERFGTEDIRLTVDKQGGRNYYGNFLSATFPFSQIRTEVESAELSAYVIEDGARRMSVSFKRKADRDDLPAALASMLSKYTRELFMEMLNVFWTQRVPGLRPTAGYVTDGRRFLAEIDEARRAEGIPLSLLARCR